MNIEISRLYVTNFLVFGPVPKKFVRGGNVKNSRRSLGTFHINAFYLYGQL